MHCTSSRIAIFSFIFLLLTPWAHAAQDINVPAELKSWVPWVLEGKEKTNCPFQYTNAKKHHCAWPETLLLNAHALGGSFSQNWTVYEKSWVALVGNRKHWPQDITVNGEPVVVTDKNGVPHLLLEKGSYQLAGNFIWHKLPEFIHLPKTTGLFALAVNEKPIDFPRFDSQGRLWLNDIRSPSSATVEDRLRVDVFRRVIDEIPLKILTRLDLNVGGQPREVVIGPIFSSDFVPLSVTGGLPMRLEVDGKLRIQLRPGRWAINILARHKALVDQLSLTPSDLPDSEIWVFDAKPSLRLVEIEGVSAIDPRQTNLPREWQHLPTYRMSKSDTMEIVTIRRGDPEPAANELMLTRNLWLDFDGGGYTFQDQINGQMRRGWRLSMSSDMHLGRAEVNGVDQLLTYLNEGSEQGIEVRQGAISIKAEGRYQADISQLPAVGWKDNFTKVQATLHLPPGWRLLTSTGADSVGGASWVEQWTLLDIFLVLIGALAVFRLFGGVWGVISLVCFVISWHEVGAPQYSWLFVIAILALLRVAPEGKLRSSIIMLRYLSLIVFAVIAIPYLIDVVRTAIHPQLEQPRVLASLSPIETLKTSRSISSDANREYDDVILEKLAKISPERKLKSIEQSLTSSMSLYGNVIDPHAKVQTGPGLPDWRWSSVPIRWDGPVQQGQMLGFMLISPAMTSALKFLSVILVLLLGLRFLGVSVKRKRITVELTKLGFIGLAVGSSFLFMPTTASADFPSADLLRDLEKRLLAPPKCLPQCAQISRMKLDVQPEFMEILLEVHANEAVAVPIPGQLGQWLPDTVLLNDKTNPVFLGKNKKLWVYVPKGKHQIKISGAMRPVRVLQLPLPLQPKHIDIINTGWVVKGVHQDGTIEKILQIEREVSENEKAKVLEQTVLPPLLTVTRTLRLGLKWRVDTMVTRTSPTGSSIATSIPLVQGETVISEGVRVKQGRAEIQFAPHQRTVTWQSILESAETLLLEAENTTDWVEQWRLDVSPMWHVEFSGIPQVHHQSKQGVWFPQWNPWPGESLRIKVSKPAGIEGKTVTVDLTSLNVKPGLRATDVSLTMRLRSSQAGQHVIHLPNDAVLGTVRINGTSLPIRQEDDGVVRLPISPGAQTIVLAWQTPQGIDAILTTPEVDIGIESVNANINIDVPGDRWILFTFGPTLGPAVLFWSVLIVVVIIAVGLGRTKQTPLKTHQWLLLGVGLSQALLGVSLLIIGWLFALGWRKTHGESVKASRFNVMQVGLGMLTCAALLGLFSAVGSGLLGHPDMQISGNGSHAHELKWYSDQSTETLANATMISVPMWVYRGLMLVWSLWLAFALLGWLKWAWQSFSAGGTWRHIPKKKKRKKQAKETGEKSSRPQTDDWSEK